MKKKMWWKNWSQVMWLKPCWVYGADTAASQWNHCGHIVLRGPWLLKNLWCTYICIIYIHILHLWTTKKKTTAKKIVLFILLWNYWHYKYCNIQCLTLCFFFFYDSVNQKRPACGPFVLTKWASCLHWSVMAVNNWAWWQVEKDFKSTVENCAVTPPVFCFKLNLQRAAVCIHNVRHSRGTKTP